MRRDPAHCTVVSESLKRRLAAIERTPIPELLPPESDVEERTFRRLRPKGAYRNAWRAMED
jgi:hypothetical protein